MEKTKIAPRAPEVMPVDPMVSMIERIILDPDADIGKLEKMLEMKERLDVQASRKAFDLAISMAKAEIPPIVKEAVVDFTAKNGTRTNYQYETLSAIAKVIDPILSKYGLSYRYRSNQLNGGLAVTCIVSHRDGHAEETALEGQPDQSGSKGSYQALGSAVTYLQRYTLKLALGLSAAKDVDSVSNQLRIETISADQFIELQSLIEETGTSLDKFLLAYRSQTSETTLEQFPVAQFAKAKAQLLRKKGNTK